MCIRDRNLWLPFPTPTFEPGHYYYEGDLKEVRDDYIREGIVPRLTMKDFLEIRQLKVTTEAGSVIVHSMPKDAQHLEEFTKLLGLAWYGEGLPSLTLKTLIHLLRPKRKRISPEVRKELSTKQGGQCAKCGREDTLEADHVHPISVDPFNRNDDDNLELLCSECHLAKTTSQQFQTDFNPIRSYFNEHTWATSSCLLGPSSKSIAATPRTNA